MSTSSTLKLALELAAKVTGREDLAALAGRCRSWALFLMRRPLRLSTWRRRSNL